jgi:hypothetical protein
MKQGSGLPIPDIAGTASGNEPLRLRRRKYVILPRVVSVRVTTQGTAWALDPVIVSGAMFSGFPMTLTTQPILLYVVALFLTVAIPQPSCSLADEARRIALSQKGSPRLNPPGAAELLPQLRLLGWRQGVGGWGAAQLNPAR